MKVLGFLFMFLISIGNVFAQENNFKKEDAEKNLKTIIEYNAKISVYAKMCSIEQPLIEKFDNYFLSKFKDWTIENQSQLKLYYTNLKFDIISSSMKPNCESFKEEFKKIQSNMN